MAKKLQRSSNNRVIAGVCGGIAEYFSTDATIIRLVCAALVLMGGTGIIAYIIAAIIIPERDRGGYQADEYDPEKDFRDYTMEDSKEQYSAKASQSGRTVFGIVLVALGAMIFAQRVFDWFKFQYMLPLILVIIGIMIIFKGGRK